MFKKIKKIISGDKEAGYVKTSANPHLSEKMPMGNKDTIIKIYEIAHNSADLLIRQMNVNDVPIAVVMCEGMFSTDGLTDLIIKPMTKLILEDATPQGLFTWVNENTIMAGDQKYFLTYGELFKFTMSGFIVMLIDGIDGGIAMGLQGFQFRSIGEPSTEINVRGSREGFVEALRINMSMLRRRMKSPDLKFEIMTVGVQSSTDICLVYRTDMASPQILEDIRHRINQIGLDNVLESGYIQPFLESSPLSIFSGIGVTERPDTLISKVAEGRVGILVDGTPFALTLPHLFAENFQSFDDYANRPYYATIIRWLKYVAFFISILLPGVYVAIATFHPELFPTALLYNVAFSEVTTPFPIFFEAFIIHLFYEIMREAGLRLPRAVGHAVSIVGGLVIGDAAVRAGLIGAPMVMVVALTAISAFVVSSLYEATMVIRFALIFAGGFLGLYGIALIFCLVILNLCAINQFGIPSASPTSPINFYSLRDVFVRVGWKTLGKEDMQVQNVPGSELKGDADK